VSKNPGCLGSILRFFGIGGRGPVALPYRLRDDFLSPAELSFYRVLHSAVANRAAVCPKVNLKDLFFVTGSNESQAYRNKIDRKHVDFLLCDPGSMQPLLGVELDDKSHQRADRQARDEFVNEVFKVAGLQLLHVPAKSSYNVGELSSLITPHLAHSPGASMPADAQPAAASADTTPSCPKCGVPMVLRTAARGSRKGEKFYGCPNYPKCRETVPFAVSPPTRSV